MEAEGERRRLHSRFRHRVTNSTVSDPLLCSLLPRNGQRRYVFNLLQRLVPSARWTRRGLLAAKALVAHGVGALTAPHGQ
eukprot:3178578-Rhodomonas_salina.1